MNNRLLDKNKSLARAVLSLTRSQRQRCEIAFTQRKSRYYRTRGDTSKLLPIDKRSPQSTHPRERRNHVILISAYRFVIHWRRHVGRSVSARPARQEQRSCRPQPRALSTPNPECAGATELSQGRVCVAYDLVATRGGVTLMVELLVPTERWPVLTASQFP